MGQTGRRVTFTFTILFMIADNARLTLPRCKKHTAYDDTMQAHATLLQKAHNVFCSLDG